MDGLTVPTVGQSNPKGGLSADTELLTPTGPTRIDAIRPGDKVYALNPLTRTAKLKAITEIRNVSVTEAIQIETRRADPRVVPTQLVPFITDRWPEPRLQRADRLTTRSEYRFITEWECPGQSRQGVIELTDLIDDYEACVATDEHGHTFRAALPDGCEPSHRVSHVGYYFDPATFERFQSELERLGYDVRIHAGRNHHRRPYRFDGDDFLQLLAWYVAEGSVTERDDRETISTKIAQETLRYRATIRGVLDRLGLSYQADDQGFTIGSYLYGQLFADLCGRGSRNKHLPKLVWNCSTGQQRLVMETLLAGDGDNERSYYTVSDRLAADVLRLCVEVGITPRYNRRRDWQVYCRHVPSRFNSRTHVRREPATQPYYQVVVEDYSAVLAGRNGTFHWIAASGVS